MRYVYKKKIYRVIFFTLDALGGIFNLPRLFSGGPGRIVPRKMLVIRVDHIGDAVGATSVLAPIRRHFPEITLDIMVSSRAAALISPLRYVDHVISFDAPWFFRGGDDSRGGLFGGVKKMSRLIARGEYDTVVDLRGDFRHILATFLAGVKTRVSYGITGGGFLLTHCLPYEYEGHETEHALRLLSPFGVGGGKVSPEIGISSGGRIKAAALLREHGVKGGYAVIHPVPGHSSKSWNVGGFAFLAKGLTGMGMTPVIIGAPGDREMVYNIIRMSGRGAIDLTGKTCLATAAALIDGAKVFVGVDSGPAHISAALGVPTLILFGGINDPRQWAPRKENVRVLYPGKGKDLSLLNPEMVMEEIRGIAGGI